MEIRTSSHLPWKYLQQSPPRDAVVPNVRGSDWNVEMTVALSAKWREGANGGCALAIQCPALWRRRGGTCRVSLQLHGRRCSGGGNRRIVEPHRREPSRLPDLAVRKPRLMR